MTAADLTPEQRDTIADVLCDDEWGPARCVTHRMVLDQIAPTVARMVADARAEGDRQGAARVAVSVETVLDEYGANDDQRATVIGELARDIRATLAQAAISEETPEGSQA